jgi:hypothetical protein
MDKLLLAVEQRDKEEHPDKDGFIVRLHLSEPLAPKGDSSNKCSICLNTPQHTHSLLPCSSSKCKSVCCSLCIQELGLNVEGDKVVCLGCMKSK